MAAEGDKPAERHVSVSATGSVAADPDMASISAGVVVEADTAKEALARNSTVMAKLIDGLKALGIAPKDIQTTAVNVEPRYVQAKDGRPATINGYRVVNQVRLTVRDVKRLGEILDPAITLGANQVNGIGFDVANAETLKDEARKQAMANAKRRAELYATAAGAQLGQRACHLGGREQRSTADADGARGDGGLRAHRGGHAHADGGGARHLRAALIVRVCRVCGSRGGGAMHTLTLVVGGLVALGIFVLAAVLLGRRVADGARVFVWPWLAASVVNMLLGVYWANMPFSVEVPVLIVVFGVPAAVAWLVAQAGSRVGVRPYAGNPPAVMNGCVRVRPHGAVAHFSHKDARDVGQAFHERRQIGQLRARGHVAAHHAAAARARSPPRSSGSRRGRTPRSPGRHDRRPSAPAHAPGTPARARCSRASTLV